MKSKIQYLLLALALLAGANRLAAQGTAFNYQGQLLNLGVPVNGPVYLEFNLFYGVCSNVPLFFPATPNPNIQPVALPCNMTYEPVMVSNGLFSVYLDFGMAPFTTGQPLYLGIFLSTNGGASYNLMTNVPIAPTPYAIAAETLIGPLPQNSLQGLYGLPVTFSNPSDSFSGRGGGLTDLNASQITTGTLPPSVFSGSYCNASVGSLCTGAAMGAGSNNSILAGVIDGFIGGGYNNTDSFGSYATVGGGESNNAIGAWCFIGGGSSNTSGGVTLEFQGRPLASTTYATVGGGYGNNASGTGSVIGGGGYDGSTYAGNTSSGAASTIAGGLANLIQSGANYSAIGGGYSNTAIGGYATVGGGLLNSVSNNEATVGGGWGNVASGQASTVPGGYLNVAAGNTSFAAGSGAKAMHDYSFVWSDGSQAVFSMGAQTFVARASGGFFFDVGGTTNVNISPTGTLSVPVLTITGGSDLAEPFKMSAREIPAGSVVVIDDEHPGGLKLSDHAYDRRVAGIVSGANGVNPGISLSQAKVLEGDRNVALSGRVYVLADSSNGAIHPGDLLTTSAKAGHAMKVTDHTRAQGAILGKAMTGLSQEDGMVLVLVTLQ